MPKEAVKYLVVQLKERVKFVQVCLLSAARMKKEMGDCRQKTALNKGKMIKELIITAR